MFAPLLLVENGLAFHYYTFSVLALSAPAIRATMGLQIVGTVAIADPVAVTWE